MLLLYVYNFYLIRVQLWFCFYVKRDSSGFLKYDITHSQCVIYNRHAPSLEKQTKVLAWNTVVGRISIKKNKAKKSISL